MLTKIVVLALYVAILFLIGIVASRRIKSMSDFYVGARTWASGRWPSRPAPRASRAGY
ncbi:hypothetical protein [Persicitalea sp.]|uniref:hypothetical protein n=1 Tax=Persicitalea sp. TaxID=3100273 RepID=UPI0035945E5C